jgi:hypothetical protein
MPARLGGSRLVHSTSDVKRALTVPEADGGGDSKLLSRLDDLELLETRRRARDLFGVRQVCPHLRARSLDVDLSFEAHAF